MSYKIQEIFQSAKKRLFQVNSYEQYKVVNSISSCRTPSMGGFAQRCDGCGHTEAHFNSCRNRHCPICQGANQQRWIEKQVANTLPLQYYHMVFTLPSELNPLALANQREIYNLLFKATSKTIIDLSKNKKFLGAQPGFSTVLHTWGQNLQFHPHIHCIVAGGGLSIDENRFIVCKDSFFLPLKAVCSVFRGKFLEGLKTFFVEGTLQLNDDLDIIEKRQNLLDKLYSKNWICYCKKPFRDSSHVIRYLGRYTHRIAISESRIVSYDKDSHKVRFKWKDYKDNNRMKIMELSEDEFVRRFLLHALPSGFMKIRHYGFLANKGREERLELCRKLLNAVRQTGLILSLEKKKIEPLANCPKCGSSLYRLVNNRLYESTPLLPTGTGP